VVATLLAGGFPTLVTAALAAAALSGLLLVTVTAGARRPSNVVIALCILASWTAASALWSSSDALRQALLPLLYAATLWLAEHGERRSLLAAMRLAILAVACLALGGRLLGLAPTAGSSSERLQWPVTYANGLGIVAATGVILWLGASTTRLRVRVPAAGICLATMFLTFSRSAAVALFAICILAAARRLPRRVLVPLLAVGLVVAVLILPSAWAAFAAPAPDSRGSARIFQISGHGRTELWAAAWHIGLDQPWIGSGAGSFRGAEGEPAHSLELQTFAELGAIGLLALAAFLATGLRQAWRDPVAAAVFGLWLIASLVDWDWQLPAATLPAIVAVASVVRRDP
jgi:hypothetical protein